MFWIGLTALLVALEQAVKFGIEKKLAEGERCPLFRGRAFLTKLHNQGTAFGKLTKKPGMVRLISVLALGAFAGLFFPVYFRKENGILKTGTSLLAAGGISNVLDRVRRGYVVDYISFSRAEPQEGKKDVRFCSKTLKKRPHFVYNLADFFIFTGAVLNVLGEAVRKK